MSNRKEKKKQTNNYSFVFNIEKLIVQHPALPSQDNGSEKQIEKQKGINKILTFLLFLSVFFQSGCLQMYIEKWDKIEPISQLIEWIFKLVELLARIKK